MAQFLASQNMRLRVLLARFIFSRAFFCITAVAIAVTCRVLIPVPFRWYEGVVVGLMLFSWPRIELIVHAKMHNAKGTRLYERHQWHHAKPNDDSALGPALTMAGYNLWALPFLYFQMPVVTTMIAVVLAAITTYEFVHFTTHFRYRPKTAWGQRIRRNHLLHHRDPHKFHEVVFPRKELAQSASADTQEDAEIEMPSHAA